MSDGSLSQDEIDALLQGTDTIEMDSAGSSSSSPLSETDRLAFQEILRGVTESQGSNLSILTGKSVTIGDPTVSARSPGEVTNAVPEQVVDVRIDLTEGLAGEHSYILAKESAATIAGLMMGQPGGELDDASLSAVAEAVSQITGTAATAIGNQIGRMIKTAPPDLKQVKRTQVRLPQGDYCVTAEYPLNIEGFPAARLTEVYSLSLVREVLSASGAAAAPQPAVVSASAPRASAARASGPAAAPGFGAPPGFQQTFGQAIGGPALGPTMAPPNVQPVQFANLQPAQMASEQGNIGLLMDVYMEMTVELGRTRKRIKDILGIGEGTIIELDKLAGEPVDILVNHKLIAKGEVVVIDENFGVRVTEIVSQIDRMSDLT
jgi:flagellar motor switch protein FliN/FliY